MEYTQKELDEFEANVRKNADAIYEFCRERGMSPIEAGAACDWFMRCIKKAISNHERNPITND